MRLAAFLSVPQDSTYIALFLSVTSVEVVPYNVGGFRAKMGAIFRRWTAEALPCSYPVEVLTPLTVLTSTVAPVPLVTYAPTVRRNNFFRSCDFSKLNYIYYSTYTG